MIKRIFLALFVVCTLTFLSGCLTTLYPFFTEKDLVFNPDLVGLWSYKKPGEEGKVYFEKIPQSRLSELSPGIRKMADKGYLLTWKDSTDTETSKYFVFMAKIGGNFYLDYYPAEMEFEKPLADAFKEQQLKMHSCYRINFRNRDAFEMKMLEASFLDELIDKKRIRIRYEEIEVLEKKRIITASTDELQQYLVKYGDEPKAYNEALSFTCTRIINY